MKKGLLAVFIILLAFTFAFAENVNYPSVKNEDAYGDQDTHWGDFYVNRIITPAGTAALPSMCWGKPCDTGFYETAANTLGVSIGGTLGFFWDSTQYGSNTSGGGRLLRTGTSATVPAIFISNDSDVGIGRAGADQLSAIAGGDEAMRFLAGVGTAVNYFQVTPHATSPIDLAAEGTGTNISISITPKGTGTVEINGAISTITTSSPLDVSDTPQAGLSGGLKNFNYAIALTDAAEDNTCTLGGTGVADCFVLPNPTSMGTLNITTSGGEFGSYTASALGVTAERYADSTNMEFNTANVAACANATLCVFDYGRALTLDSLSEDTCSGSDGDDCDGVYTGVTTTAASAGTGVILTVTIESDLITAFEITSSGLSYVVDETLTLDGLVAAGCTECDDDATLDILTEGHVGIQNNIAATTTVMVQFWYD